VKRVAPLLLLALAVAGCGGGGHGHASIWITRDEGRHVLAVRTVPAGLTAVQALERVAKVSTRYGGRFVQSIDGLDGSLRARRDWFYFVNGIEASVGAAEYRLHPGDVEWWDYRDWGRYGQSVPVVVGAFPEPFVHGYGGKVRPVVVIGTGAAARELARVVHGRVAGTAPRGADVLRIVDGPPHLTAHLRAGGGVEFDFAGDPARLARHPESVRYRYSLP
jgi:hypothetical protein